MSDTNDNGETDGVLMVSCVHGSRPAAVVCRHLLDDRGPVRGFVENCHDPADLQAWCGDCEKLFVDEGEEMTARFREFNDFALVCDVCYATIKAGHLAN